MDDQEIQDGAQPSVCLAKVRQRHGAERRKSTAPGTLEKMKERIEVRRAAEEKKKENLLRDQDVSVYRVRVSSSLFCYDSGIPLKPVPGAVEKSAAHSTALAAACLPWPATRAPRASQITAPTARGLPATRPASSWTAAATRLSAVSNPLPPHFSLPGSAGPFRRISGGKDSARPGFFCFREIFPSGEVLDRDWGKLYSVIRI